MLVELLDNALDNRVAAEQECQVEQVLMQFHQLRAMNKPAHLDHVIRLAPPASPLIVLGQDAKGKREDECPVAGHPVDQAPVEVDVVYAPEVDVVEVVVEHAHSA